MTLGSRVAAALVAAAASLVGCSRPAPTASWECKCEYTTDTDVPGVQDVHVCAKQGEDPKALASECAQSLGVGQVERCTCAEVPDGCDGPACEQAAAHSARQ